MELQIFNIAADCEIRSSRIFVASPEILFRAWSDPEILKKWWGPAGFTNTFKEFDFRPGGRWRFTMHGPEKGNYENECEFEIIEHPRLIVWNRISRPLFRVVASFEPVENNHTMLTFRMQFATAEECEKIRRFALDKNEENFDKLELEISRLTKPVSTS